jgi:hypothetical protein
VVGLQPDIIVTGSTLATVALQRETRTIPIVAAGAADPLASGLVPRLNQPGGNITGFASWQSVRLADGTRAPSRQETAQHACKLGLEGFFLKREDSRYRFGRSPDWIKSKNPKALAATREAEDDWGQRWTG